jgi:hypothetical protein
MRYLNIGCQMGQIFPYRSTILLHPVPLGAKMRTLGDTRVIELGECWARA